MIENYNFIIYEMNDKTSMTILAVLNMILFKKLMIEWKYLSCCVSQVVIQIT